MIDSNKLNERKFYYIDVKNNIKFELKEFEKTYSSIEINFKHFVNMGFKLDRNNNYYYIHRYLSKENNEIGVN